MEIWTLKKFYTIPPNTTVRVFFPYNGFLTLLQTAVGIFGSGVSCLPTISLLLANQLQLYRGLVCRPSPAGKEIVTQP